LYVLDIFWWSHVENYPDFRGISAYAVAIDDVAEQYAGGDLEDAFLGLSFHLYLFSALKIRSRLSIRVLGVSGFDDNVIDISFDKVITYFVVETLLNGTLICGSGIF